MSLQIKIFSSAHVNLDGLENQVNNWLAEHSNCQVQDIKVAFSENHIIMTLLYQLEKSAMKSPPQVQRNQVEIQRQVPAVVNNRPSPLVENNNYPKQEQRLNLDMGINNMSQMNSISPKAIKPAKNFVQKNYNKYTNTGNISEDEAFDWN